MLMFSNTALFLVKHRRVLISVFLVTLVSMQDDLILSLLSQYKEGKVVSSDEATLLIDPPTLE